jgi:hypothetical protein
MSNVNPDAIEEIEVVTAAPGGVRRRGRWLHQDHHETGSNTLMAT